MLLFLLVEVCELALDRVAVVGFEASEFGEKELLAYHLMDEAGILQNHLFSGGDELVCEGLLKVKAFLGLET